MEQIYRDRLKAISDYLKKEDFNGIKKFDFSNWTNNLHKDGDGHLCGTSACAVGFLPLIFPGVISYTPSYNGLIIEGKNDKCYGGPHLERFLGLTTQELEILFIPNPIELIYKLSYADFGGKITNLNATPEEVAYNIDQFLKWKDTKSEAKFIFEKGTKYEGFIERAKAWWNWKTYNSKFFTYKF